MDELNGNNRPENSSENDIFASNAENSYVDRKEKVKNFKVHIEEDDTAFVGDEYMSDLPVYKGEVYFANHAKKQDSFVSNAQNGQRKHTAQNQHKGAANGTAHRTSKPKDIPIRKKKPSVLSGTLKMLIAISLCTLVLSATAITCVNDILAINRDSVPVTVEIPEGATTSEVISILGDNDLISRPMLCKMFYKTIGVIKKSKTPEYISGIFYLKANMGLEGMLNKLKETQNYSETVTVSFPEGLSIYQIFNKLDEYGVCDKDYLYKAADGVNFNYAFLDSAKANDDDDRYQLLEGYFFPDTYEFFVDLNANSVIERFLDNFGAKWTAEYQARADELNMTVDQVITLASIIQREAANVEQMPKISSVLHNRLNNYVTYPTLDCDSTSNYITNYVKPVAGEVLADRYMDSYNTYICDRLPAGSICNPGNDAIHAALYPDNTEYYYFQHDADGNIYMAKTNAEHNRYKNQIALQSAR